MNNEKCIYVFGEIHSDADNVKYIQERIVSIKPQYLLHELLYEDECYTTKKIKERLSDCKDGGTCDPRLNKDLYELGLLLNMNLVGIDLNDPTINKLSVQKQFEIREAHMVSVIMQFMNINKRQKIVIVVGDTHLREKDDNNLKSISPLIALFHADRRVVVERAPENIQEMK